MNQPVTRTIKGICIVTIFADLFLLSIKFKNKTLAPGYAHLHAIKIQYTLTVFWLRSDLYRDTRNAQPNLYRDDKTCAKPSLHQEYLPIEVSGPCPDGFATQH